MADVEPARRDKMNSEGERRVGVDEMALMARDRTTPDRGRMDSGGRLLS